MKKPDLRERKTCQGCGKRIINCHDAKKLRILGWCLSCLPDKYRCHAKTNDGDRCLLVSDEGHQYCNVHMKTYADKPLYEIGGTDLPVLLPPYLVPPNVRDVIFDNPEDDPVYWQMLFDFGRMLTSGVLKSGYTRDQCRRIWKYNYIDYIKSKPWAEKSAQAKKRAGYRCQLCNSDGTLNAHHRTYERLGNENENDIIALCSKCHAKFHDKEPS